MRKIIEYIGKVEMAVAAGCLLTSTVLIFLAAVMRSFDRPINWSLDISLFLIAWATFLSADVAYREDKLVNVDMFVYRLPRRAQLAVQVILNLLILAFLIVLVYFGFKLAYLSRARAFQGIPRFSYSWITLSMPVGALLLSRTAIGKLIRLVSGNSDAASTGRLVEGR